jgi:HlyD family secretion protein
MKTLIKILIGLVILLVFAGTLAFLYNKSSEKTVFYETTMPVVTTIIKKAVATGSIVPRKEIEIKPQVSGVVEQIHVEAGDRVKAGDLLAKVYIIPDLVNLNKAESRLKIARIQVYDTKKSCDRRRKLFKKGIVAESDLQQYEVAYSNAKEELAAAETNLELVKEGIAKNMGTTTNTLIRSTIDGMVLDVPMEVGNFVIETNNFNAGTTIATVADMGEMIFEGKVDESEVGKIEPGMDLILTVGAIEHETFNASLEYISPKGLEEKGAIQFEIRAKVKLKQSHFLRAGYSAIADIVLDRRDNVLAINESLLQFDSDKAFVEVATGPEQFEKRNIQTGLSDGINIEIISGLEKTDKIKIWDKPIKK